MAKPTIEQAYKSSSVIFTGDVTKIETVTFPDTIYFNNKTDSSKRILFERKMMKITFAFKEILKGEFINKVVNEIYTDISVSSCGFDFYLGKTFLVYSNYSKRLDELFPATDRVLSTNICTRTKILNESGNEEVLELNKLKKGLQ